MTVIVSSPNIAVAFNGKLLEKDTVMDEEGNVVTVHRFATETLTAARAVGMAVGRFGVWDVPQSPRMKGMFLRAYVDQTSEVQTLLILVWCHVVEAFFERGFIFFNSHAIDTGKGSL